MRQSALIVRGAAAAALLVLAAGIAESSDRTKLPEGANHLAAHARATGAGVTIGIVDLEGVRQSEEFGAFNGGIINQGVPNPNAGLPLEPPMVTGHTLGARFLGNFSYSGRAPRTGGFAYLVNGTDRHPTLGADIAAGGDFRIKVNPPTFPAQRDFVGVAKASDVYFAGVGAAFSDLQAAVDDLQRVKGARVMNYSVGEGPVDSDNARQGGAGGADESALFLDWFINKRDIVFVKSAGNRGGMIGTDDESPGAPVGGDRKVSKPGDFYNGITVGATDMGFRTRAVFSSYWLNSDNGAAPDIRGKPDIVAPGDKVWNGKVYRFTLGTSGTSFAAPHVTGVASMLWQRIAAGRKHEAIKAMILNSARKRHINGTNTASAFAQDLGATALEESDYDYTNGTAFRVRAGVGKTALWTPSAWTYAAGGKFTTTKPLDDELGAGALDADRAVRQHNAGEFPAGAVPVYGWSRGQFAAPGGGGAPPVTQFDYPITDALKPGTFLTVTLCWDRLVTETDAMRNNVPELPMLPNSAVDAVDQGDTYAYRGMTNLDLLIFRQGAGGLLLDYAESVSTTDNVEHLHIPITQNAKYTIRVKWTGKDGTVDVPTPYALAWKALAACCPGDANKDGSVNFLDITTVLANFNNVGNADGTLVGDADCNGVVNFADLTTVLGNFLSTCPT
ncbi:MAG: S8 family serine peptidase [Phycisphaerae bacterium]|nr:S8 family serine peptidase [Phycisphaerae bacterium]